MREALMMSVLALALVALFGAQDGNSSTSNEFTAPQRAEGEAMVKEAGKNLANKLNDPDSARFRNVLLQKRVGPDKMEHVVLCGEINAKNGYGGMSGWHNFINLGGSLVMGGVGGIMDADNLCSAGKPIIDARDYTAELKAAFKANTGQ